MINRISSNQNIKFNESEQELFDALLDEYNDIFENILNISEKKMFDKILENVNAILDQKNINIFKNENSQSSSFIKIKLLSSRYYIFTSDQRGDDFFR